MNSTCFTTTQFKRITDVIGALSETISTGDDRSLKSRFLFHCGSRTSINEDEWSQKAEALKNELCKERIVDVNLTTDQVALSDWKDGNRNVVFGEIWRFMGCYEMAMCGGRLDTDDFISELMRHGHLKVIGGQDGPAFAGMQM